MRDEPLIRTCLNCRREVKLRWDERRNCYRCICRCGATCSMQLWFDAPKITKRSS